MDKIITEDDRNFHAWEYFIWYAKRWNKAEWLLQQTEKFIQSNPFNSSAWSCRSKVFNILQLNPSSDIDFACNLFTQRPLSESTANYLKNLYLVDNSLSTKIREVINKILERNNSNIVALSLLVTIEENEGNNEQFEQLVTRLSELDKQRATFWLMIKNHDPKFQ